MSNKIVTDEQIKIFYDFINSDDGKIALEKIAEGFKSPSPDGDCTFLNELATFTSNRFQYLLKNTKKYELDARKSISVITNGYVGSSNPHDDMYEIEIIAKRIGN